MFKRATAIRTVVLVGAVAALVVIGNLLMPPLPRQGERLGEGVTQVEAMNP